jgi:ribosomal protein S13
MIAPCIRHIRHAKHHPSGQNTEKNFQKEKENNKLVSNIRLFYIPVLYQEKAE